MSGYNVTYLDMQGKQHTVASDADSEVAAIDDVWSRTPDWPPTIVEFVSVEHQ
jgi:hypothetical protein